MTTDAFHPDHLKPGDMVGPWQIVESLGSGNFGHAFKAELAGGVLHAEDGGAPGTRALRGHAREGPGGRAGGRAHAPRRRRPPGQHRHPTACNACAPWAAGPTPRGLLLTSSPTTCPASPSMTGESGSAHRRPARGHLHGGGARGGSCTAAASSSRLQERARHRPEDPKPVLMDLGSAWLPGGSSLTVGLAPGTPHALPPSASPSSARAPGSRAPGSTPRRRATSTRSASSCTRRCGLLALQSRLPKDELLVAIEKVVPRPHRMNPRFPSRSAHRPAAALEKSPGGRYESAEALLQALWDANKERCPQRHGKCRWPPPKANTECR